MDTNAFMVESGREAGSGTSDNGFCVIRLELDAGGKPADWVFLHVNEALARMEGKPVEAFVGHRFFELFPERNRDRLLPHYEAACHGKTVSFDDVSEEIGRFVHIDVYPTGEPGCCACVLHSIREEVSAKMQEQQKLENLVGQLEVINALATLYTTIMVTDLRTHEYRVIRSVPLLKDALGGRLTGNFDFVLDNVVSRLMCPEMRDGMHAFFNLGTLSARLENTDTVFTEYRDNSGRWFVSRFIVLERDTDGHAVSALYAARDITVEKEKELHYLEQVEAAATEADRANLSKTNFLRRMSHDIRTPLNGIIGMLKIMDSHEGDPIKYREYMDKITRSADYLLSIVNNVLDISKMETGNIELEHRPFDLADLLLNILPLVSTNASQNSVIFAGSSDDSHIRHRYVIGSPVHLKRILMNVASNAIKYNRSGGSLKIYCNELKCDGEQAVYEFVCEDTGIGMSEAFQKRAFEPFTQEGKPSTTGFAGSGLGLSIVKKIVAQMGGSIELRSRENVGTTVRIVLTMTLDKHPEQNRKENEAADTIDLSGRRALLVEDNEINMEIASVLLKGLGLAVTNAWNGQQAVELFRNAEPYTFDVIFMDMMMPVMDGLEATRTIRGMRRPDAASVPVIAMTANAFAEDRQMCLEAGMNEHIGKPIDSREVVRMLYKFVK